MAAEEGARDKGLNNPGLLIMNMIIKKKNKDLGEVELNVKYKESKKVKSIKEKISEGLNKIANKIKNAAKKVKD